MEDEDDLPVKFGCGSIPLEDMMAYMDINQNPDDKDTLEILLERGSYGNSWREIESYFQNHFSECPDCRTEYDNLVRNLETIQLGCDEIRRWVRDYRSKKSK